MSYLHENKFMHRDLKSLNVLLDSRGRARIADFGLSRLTDEINPKQQRKGEGKGQGGTPVDVSTLAGKYKSMEMTGASGTMLWMAPEVLRQQGNSARYGYPADVYSFGIVLYEIATRLVPWHDVPPPAFLIMAKVLKQERPTVPAEIEAEVQTCPARTALLGLMRTCWDHQPTGRPTFAQCLQILTDASQETTNPLNAATVNRVQRKTSATSKKLDALSNQLPSARQPPGAKHRM